MKTIKNLSPDQIIILDEINKAVSDYYLVALKKPGRKRENVDARKMFCKIASEFNFSKTNIGKYLGKNHATVIYSIRTIDEYMGYDANIRIDYRNIKSKLKRRSTPFSGMSRDELEEKFVNLEQKYDQLIVRYDLLKEKYDFLTTTREHTRDLIKLIDKHATILDVQRLNKLIRGVINEK